jgi:hypothetical protein
MKSTLSILIFYLLLFSACAAPTPELATSTSEPTLTFTPEITTTAEKTFATLTAIPSSTVTSLPAGPTKTLVPTLTAIPFPSQTVTATPGPSTTPIVPTAFSPDGKPVECFKGPELEYKVLTDFKIVEIVGVDEAGRWWYLKIDKGQGNFVHCWVLQKRVTLGGNPASLPVVEPEKALVTEVSLSIPTELPDARFGYVQTVSCGQNADKPVFHFLGRISADGPIQKVKYTWETNAPGKFSVQQTRVAGWRDPQNIKLDLPVPAREGTYYLRLRVSLPNEMSMLVQFVVKCQ